jgi:hypothetical protein
MMAAMEALEHIVKVHLEGHGYVVSGGLKFPVTCRTKKRLRAEHQTHGYEVDLVERSSETTYVNDPVVVTLTILRAAGLLGSAPVARRSAG